MKKIVLFLMLMIMPLSVNAKNIIHSIDIDVYLNDDGSANITEVWDVDGSDGTEWYKVINNLGNMELSNFTVSMDGSLLTYKKWDIDETLTEKRGYYGIVSKNNGVELCFGKYDYKRHKFTLNYTLSNFIINTSDSQLIYYNFIDKLSSVDFRNFSVNISSYYEFPDTLDVWGYGYKGYAYVNSGKIGMSNEENSEMNDKYGVLLAKFPLGTFNTYNRVNGYNDFETVYNMAQEGSYAYNYNESDILGIIIVAVTWSIMIFVFVVVGVVTYRHSLMTKYGYFGNKKISKKDIPMFRDIPCNKDIYYANTLLKLNNFKGYKEGNILGAIILKWVRNNKVIFRNVEKGIFNKDSSVIDLTMNPTFDNEHEEKLFNMMLEASKDGYLRAKEFERWCNSNYSKFLNLFKKMDNSFISYLKETGMIYRKRKKTDCKYGNVMNDKIYDESVKLYGLWKYLEEFSSINTKEVMEVKLWDEYLMFAYLFGIADKVTKQLKNMYPEVIHEMETSNLAYDTLYFIDHISTSSIKAASAARAAANAYSSGGGGFSSGGGGGGSFGGGGGGSR